MERSLRPHHVMPVLDADIFDGQVVIVSEFAADGCLRAWLRKHEGKRPLFIATNLILASCWAWPSA